MTSKHLTLFCFPCAGASAAGYLRWRRLLPSWVDIQPVELPGRGRRLSEPFIRDFEPLVEKLAAEISLRIGGDYALFGHSFGGLLAYGCAHRLRDGGWSSPVAILTACSPSPSRRKGENLSYFSTDDELIEKLRNLNGTPSRLFEDPELLRITLDATAADFSVCSSFKYLRREPLHTRFFIFGGRDDDVDQDALLGWQNEGSLQTTVEMFDGGHFFIRDDGRRFLDHLQGKLRSLV